LGLQIFDWIGKRLNQNMDIDAEGEQMLAELLSDLQKAQAFSEQKGEC
jgi:hypothetical protein